MENAIGRKRLFGIALESTFGVPATSPTFILPMLDLPTIQKDQKKAENESAMGSQYGVNSVVNTIRESSVSVNVKIDERHLPMFFAQRFAITSATVSGDASAYQHQLSYSTTVDKSYTLFVYDPDRGSMLSSGNKFSTLNVIAEQGYLRLEGEAMGKYVSTWTNTASASQPYEFVGRNVTASYAEYTTTTSTISILKATLNHNFGLSNEEFNFELGNQDKTANVLTNDRFETEITKRLANYTFRDQYSNNTKLKWKLNIIDTGRQVSNQNPSIVFDYPVGYMISHSEEGDLNNPLTETFRLLAVDEVGVSDAPLKITVVNSIASY